jgi:hypothetical protein
MLLLEESLIHVLNVMPDFMSGIHDLKIIYKTKSWMAGASPAMTWVDVANASVKKQNALIFFFSHAFL